MLQTYILIYLNGNEACLDRLADARRLVHWLLIAHIASRRLQEAGIEVQRWQVSCRERPAGARSALGGRTAHPGVLLGRGLACRQLVCLYIGTFVMQVKITE